MAKQLLFVVVMSMLPILVSAAASQPSASALSRWISKDMVPQLQEQFANHPRFAGAHIQISSATPDALSEAVATVLLRNFQGTSGITLSQPAHSERTSTFTKIDQLNCSSGTSSDYQLLVSVFPETGRRARVDLQLLESANEESLRRIWQWRGKLSSAESKYMQSSGTDYIGRGQIEAPWTNSEFDLAAKRLSHDFACALRPGTDQHTTLEWSEGNTLSAPFSDTNHASRALLGQLDEVSVVEGSGDYKVQSRVQQLSGGIWQLWLVGQPVDAGSDPVQAVTYFVSPGLKSAHTATPAASTSRPSSRPSGAPLDYIAVELLDTLQSDTGRRSASLEVVLNLSNRAEWPIEYSFTLSGGHFNHCVAREGYYRHDQYGTITGSIAAGESRVQRLTIDKTVHRPTPLFGQPQCAGFRDIDGFENFASQGYKVTDFVRWAR